MRTINRSEALKHLLHVGQEVPVVINDKAVMATYVEWDDASKMPVVMVGSTRYRRAPKFVSGSQFHRKFKNQTDSRVAWFLSEFLPVVCRRGNSESVDHSFEELMPKAVLEHWGWGRCFTAATFPYFMAGGPSSDWILSCTWKAHVWTTPDGREFRSSHWFLIHRTLPLVQDYSCGQFRPFKVDLQALWANSMARNYGFKQIRSKSGEIRYFDHVVPSATVRRLYAGFWRPRFGINETLESYL